MSSSKTSRRALVTTALIGFVIGIAVSVRFDLSSPTEAISLFGGEQKEPPQGPSVTLPDFATLAEHISPSVVSISSTQEVKSRGPFGGQGGGPGGPGGPGGEDDPFQDFYGPFERFFGPPRGGRPLKAKRLGSGFILHSKGFILNQNHRVRQAHENVAKLPSGKDV